MKIISAIPGAPSMSKRKGQICLLSKDAFEYTVFSLKLRKSTLTYCHNDVFHINRIAFTYYNVHPTEINKIMTAPVLLFQALSHSSIIVKFHFSWKEVVY